MAHLQWRGLLLGNWLNMSEKQISLYTIRHFIEIVMDVRLEEDGLLTGFDMQSLCTKVHIPDTKDYWWNSQRRTWICFDSTYLYFEGKFYEKTEGAAEESHVTPIAANLYMKRLENMVLERLHVNQKYGFDTWIIDTLCTGISTPSNSRTHAPNWTAQETTKCLWVLLSWWHFQLRAPRS